MQLRFSSVFSAFGLGNEQIDEGTVYEEEESAAESFC